MSIESRFFVLTKKLYDSIITFLNIFHRASVFLYQIFIIFIFIILNSEPVFLYLNIIIAETYPVFIFFQLI